MQRATELLIRCVDAATKFESDLGARFEAWLKRQNPWEFFGLTCLAGVLACGIAVVLILSKEPPRVVRLVPTVNTVHTLHKVGLDPVDH